MNIREHYNRLRGQGGIVGEDAKCALAGAKTIARFRESDRVRIRAFPEEENYFDVYGQPSGYTNREGNWVTPEQERQNICDTIERDGCWQVVSEYLSPEGKWEAAGSIGMCTGYADPCSPFCNPYVIDLMDEALEALDAAWETAGEAV